MNWLFKVSDSTAVNGVWLYTHLTGAAKTWLSLASPWNKWRHTPCLESIDMRAMPAILELPIMLDDLPGIFGSSIFFIVHIKACDTLYRVLTNVHLKGPSLIIHQFYVWMFNRFRNYVWRPTCTVVFVSGWKMGIFKCFLLQASRLSIKLAQGFCFLNSRENLGVLQHSSHQATVQWSRTCCCSVQHFPQRQCLLTSVSSWAADCCVSKFCANKV